MTFEQYKASFEEIASNSGYAEQNIQRCLAYARVLFINNVPVIYNTSHLSALVGYKKDYIKRAVTHTSYFYRDFEIKKRNGTKRKISEPLPSLKEIQIWILENILYNVNVSPFAKAYRKNVGLIDNVRFHKRQSMVFTVDLVNFFGSINQTSVERIFSKLGYSKLLANLLSKLCTKDNQLPQGAPTSPYLSNIFFKVADDSITKYCLDRKIRYTRYADDLSFSGTFNHEELMQVLREILSDLNLMVNESKTRLMTKGMRQSVTGVVVNEKPQVVFYKRNKIRQEIFFIKKFGLPHHMSNAGIKNSNYLSHLRGKVNFVLQLNPSDVEFQEYRYYLFSLRQE